MKKKIILIVLTISYILLIKTFMNMYVADIKFKSSEKNLKQNILKSLKNINESITLNPNEPEYYRQRAKIYAVINQPKKALSDLQTAYELNRNNIPTIRDSLPIYTLLAALENTPKQNLITQEYFNLLKNKYKNDAGTLVDIAKYEKKLNHEENYNETLVRIKQLRPDLLKWHPDLL